MTDPRPTPFRHALTGLLLAPVLAALTGCSGPAPTPPAAASVPTPARSADVTGFFGGGDIFVVYDRDSSGLPTVIRRVTTDPGTALEPFLAEQVNAHRLDCLRLTPAPSATAAPQAGLCDARLWHSRAIEGTSTLALSDARDPLIRLTDTTLSQMQQAVSGLGSLTGSPSAAPAESSATRQPAAPPLVEAARRVIPLLALGYSADRTAALSGGDSAAAFLHTYPSAPEPDRLAVAEAALRQVLNRPGATGELRRVLRVLPLTPDQKTQGLNALRQLQSLDGWLSALRLGGSATDLRQARALAARSPGRHDTRVVEESAALDQALRAPDGAAALFSLSAPAHWNSQPGPPDSLSLKTAVLSAPVTLSARPPARLHSGTYDVTVRISAVSSRSYSHRTPQGETVQATARSSTETDVVFTLSPPAYRQTLTVVLPEIAAPGGSADTGGPEITLSVRSVDLKP